MGDNTKIEWADATWNVIRGCVKVSPGCAHCYAETLVNGRLRGDFSKLQVLADRLEQPLQWKRPRLIFVNSLSDLFWDEVPDELIDQHFAIMALADQHVFQVLTKRIERARDYLSHPYRVGAINDAAGKMGRSSGWRMPWSLSGSPATPLEQRERIGPAWPLPNVAIVATVENQPMADKRIPALLATPARWRGLSVEPMLGNIELDPFLAPSMGLMTDGSVRPFQGLDWVIAGGESGKDARPLHPDWARRLRDQCVAAGVPFFFKQWGEWGPDDDGERVFRDVTTAPNVVPWFGSGTARMWRKGKKAAGRLLDGRTWDEYPEGMKR